MNLDQPASAVLRRRAFLKWASAASAALSALLIGVPSLRAFLSPGFQRPTKKGWVKVAEADLLDISTPVKVDFVEDLTDAWVESRAIRTVWLYTEDGESFTAFSGVCTHLGCSVSFDAEPNQYHEGKNMFHCPCHHGIFDMKTGAVVGGPPPRGLDTLPVRVEDGNVLVQFTSFRTGIPDKVEL